MSQSSSLLVLKDAVRVAGPDLAELENEADMDDDDGVASVMSGSVLHGPR